jgi:sporulation protein YlmC with PRC-barrel domain
MDDMMVKTHMISSQSLIGVDVGNDLGENLGQIKEILVDPANGFVVNLILETSDMFGFKKHVAVPWDMLKFDENGAPKLNHIEKDFIKRIPAYMEE